MHYQSRISCFLGALLLSLFAIGCGGGTGTVTGKVTLDGEPLPLGEIQIVPEKGGGAFAIIKDGSYTVENVPTGPAKVSVSTNKVKLDADAAKMSGSQQRMFQGKTPENLPPEAQKQFADMQKAAKEGAAKAKELMAKYRAIPNKYNNPATSGLSLTVSGGTNNFDVPLSSK